MCANTEGDNNLELLPDEIGIHILSYLDIDNIGRFLLSSGSLYYRYRSYYIDAISNARKEYYYPTFSLKRYQNSIESEIQILPKMKNLGRQIHLTNIEVPILIDPILGDWMQLYPMPKSGQSYIYTLRLFKLWWSSYLHLNPNETTIVIDKVSRPAASWVQRILFKTNILKKYVQQFRCVCLTPTMSTILYHELQDLYWWAHLKNISNKPA